MEIENKDQEYNLFEPEEEKRPRHFARSVSNSVIGGVCGGIGEYINIEPNLLRVIFALGTFAGGWGIIIYIAAVLLMPIKPDDVEYTEEEINELNSTDPKTIIGTVMILSGIYFILAPTGLLHFFKFLGAGTESAFILLFISAGISLIKHTPLSGREDKPENIDKLYRSPTNKRLMGVCGGLADYLKLDPTLLRVVSVISIIATAGISIIIYLIFSFIVPNEVELISDEQ